MSGAEVTYRRMFPWSCAFCGTRFQTELERNRHEKAKKLYGGCFK